MFAALVGAPPFVAAENVMFCQNEYCDRSMPPTVPVLGESATSNCRPPIELATVPSPYAPCDNPLRKVRSPFFTRPSSRLMMASSEGLLPWRLFIHHF